MNLLMIDDMGVTKTAEMSSDELRRKETAIDILRQRTSTESTLNHAHERRRRKVPVAGRGGGAGPGGIVQESCY